jgi:endonuclease YncB( thermonuclease family)
MKTILLLVELVRLINDGGGLPDRTPLLIGEPDGHVTVIDGDTLMAGGIVIDLWGVDAPDLLEICEDARGPYRCGEQAALALRLLARPRELTCTVIESLGPGHVEAICMAEEENVNFRLIEEGVGR